MIKNLYQILRLIIYGSAGSYIGIYIRHVILYANHHYFLFGNIVLVSIYNVLSAFLLGIFLRHFHHIEDNFHRLKVLITFGCLGSLSSFSSYVLVIFQLWKDKTIGYMLLFILVNNLGSLLAIILGRGRNLKS